MSKTCYAPVFTPNSGWACWWLILIYTLVIVYLAIMLVIALLGGPKAVSHIACLIKQYVYRIANCMRGNDNPTLEI